MLIGITLDLQIHLGRTGSFRILSLSIHEHGITLHLLSFLKIYHFIPIIFYSFVPVNFIQLLMDSFWCYDKWYLQTLCTLLVLVQRNTINFCILTLISETLRNITKLLWILMICLQILLDFLGIYLQEFLFLVFFFFSNPSIFY